MMTEMRGDTLHNPKPTRVYLVQSLSPGVLHHKTTGRGSLGGKSETSAQLVAHLRIPLAQAGC